MSLEMNRSEAALTRANVKRIMKRVAEVQALFVLVERIAPFVRDLVDFVYDVGPMLAKAGKSLRDSSAKMPRASQQLDNVTEATEAATTAVLDKVDEILANLDEIQRGLDQWKKAASTVRRLDRMVKALVAEIPDPHLANQISRLEGELGTLKKQLRGFRAMDRRIDLSRECAYEIMSALQVQDITAQQLAAARELMDRVYARIQELLQQLGEEDEVPRSEERPRSYDPNARFDFAFSERRQQEVDRLLRDLLQDMAEARNAEGVAAQNGGSA